MKHFLKKKAPIILIGILILVILGGIVWLLARGNSSEDNAPSSDEICIQTPYCELRYPKKWETYLRVEQIEGQPYAVAFYANVAEHAEQHLFDILFGGVQGEYLGRFVLADGTDVDISMMQYNFEHDKDWDQESIDIVNGMRRDVLYIVNRLPALSQATQEDIVITTPYCDLHYPQEWEAYLRFEQVEGQDYTIAFYANVPGYAEQHLFDFLFGGGGDYIGKLACEDGTKVDASIRQIEVSLDDWDQESADIIRGMQYGARYLINRLPVVAVDEDAEDVIINTPYCQLHYPGTWASYLRFEQLEGPVHTVRFYANVADHAEQHLFDILFGSSEGDYIGELNQTDGQKVSVSLQSFEFVSDDTWSQDEIQIIRGMNSGVRYLINQLELADS